MGIVVLIELDADHETGPSGSDPAVVAVHAAGPDPDVPLDPLPVTLCGRDTAAMERTSYQRDRPGQPWYPPEFAKVRCPECERALRQM
ncbi:hypothetical protein [Kitasatospora griseola]|uniref:hypothetical protein n=1 Tax=Kitasatospora griseola TaxID=2064 RepID=UPI0038104936